MYARYVENAPAYGLGRLRRFGLGDNITAASFNPTNVMANVMAAAAYQDARSQYGDNDPRTQAALQDWNQTRNVIGASQYVVTTPTNPSMITPQLLQQGSFDEQGIYSPTINQVIPPANVPSQPVTVNTQPVTTTTPTTTTTNTNVAPTTQTPSTQTPQANTPVQTNLLQTVQDALKGWMGELTTPGGGSGTGTQVGTGSSISTSNEWINGVPNWLIVAGGGFGVLLLTGMFAGNRRGR